MKKLITILCLTTIMFSCSFTPQQKCEKAVKEYLLKNLDDNKSYESVEFYDFRIDSTKFENTTIYIDYHNNLYYYKADSIKSVSNDPFLELSMSDRPPLKTQKEKLEKLLIVYNDNLKNFNSKFDCFFIKHKFRAKNKMGGVVLTNSYFALNSNFKVIGSGMLDNK